MKVALVERIGADRLINKDQMGGLGLVTTIGDGFRARLIQRQTRRRVPILALGYAAAIFTRDGHEVQVVTDGRVVDVDLTIVYSSIVEAQHERDYVRAVKNRDGRVAVIGPFASNRPEFYASVADCVIRGEPEAALVQIARSGAIPTGIVDSPQIPNLDDLPFPVWEPFPLHEYSYYPIVPHKPFVTVQASRGCSFTCSYCPYVAYFGDVRRRSVASVVNEIRNLVTRYGVRGFYFRDPLFSHDRKWTEQLAVALKELGAMTPAWGCETRMELLDEPLVDALYDAGLRAINTGVESADTNVLVGANRRNGFTKMERMIAYCERRGIRVTGFYVLGLVEDDRDSIRRTIEYAKQLNTFGAKFHLSTPFPGTPFYEQVKERIFEDNWERFDSSTPVFTHPTLTGEELLDLKRRAYVSYYLRRSYFMKHWRHVAGAWGREFLTSVASPRPPGGTKPTEAPEFA